MAWEEILAADIGVGKPITQGLMTRLLNRDEALRDRGISMSWAVLTVTVSSGGDEEMIGYFGEVYVPQAAVYMDVEAEAWRTVISGSPGSLQQRVGLNLGATDAYGAYVVNGDTSATRRLFPAVTVDASQRGQVCRLI